MSLQFVISLAVCITGAVSAVAAYAGITTALPHDNLWWKLFAALVAGGIGIGVFAFWHVAEVAVMKPRQKKNRVVAWMIIFGGSFLLCGISAYWHVTALGGPTVQTAAIYASLDAAEKALATAETSRKGGRSFRSRLEGLSTEVGNYAACERTNGCVSGSAGAKGIHGTLVAMKGKVDGVLQSLGSDDGRFDGKLAEGRKCLADFRASLGKGLPGDGGTAGASAALDCVNGAIAAVDGNGQRERIAQELDSLTAGLVIPASIKTPAQKQAVANIVAGLKERAASIASDARNVASGASIEPVTLSRTSPMKAVILHWDEILPAWLSALFMDLLPGVLLAFQAILAASRRDDPDVTAADMSVRDVITAQSAFDHLWAVRAPKFVPKRIASDPVSGPKPGTVIYMREGEDGEYWEEDLDIREGGEKDDRPEAG